MRPNESPHVAFAIFFPPVPPVYGTEIPDSPHDYLLLSAGRRMVPPDELAEWVGEIFYPALGSRWFDGALAGKLKNSLQAYRAERAALLNELDGAVDRLRSAEPAAREQQWQALALQQAPRLDALEQKAEQLRIDLIHGTGVFNVSFDWNQGRAWRIGDSDLTAEPRRSEALFQVVRAAAFYENGFRVEQRGLLRELAGDLAVKAYMAQRHKPPPGPAPDPAAIYFAPETTRLHLSGNLPPELASQLGRFNHDKDALKQELLAAVIAIDRASSRKRSARFSQLAGEQAAALAALEPLAEEIRRGLARLAEIPPPWVPPVPGELAEKIARYIRGCRGLAAEFEATLEEAQVQTIRPWDIGFGVSAADRQREIERRSRQARAQRGKVSAEFERTHSGRIAELRALYEAIEAEAAKIAQGIAHSQSGGELTGPLLLRAYHVSEQWFDAVGREEAMYARYRTAMLQPGLSPAQRRLLFKAAQVSLAQALPGGEAVTTARDRPWSQSTIETH